MMEYFWLLLASAGAGIGTGLAGLSAATVMVPILIVLCPSFAGETGAYQATAIALASDILGSAVTTMVYIRNRNIDLKRGWIMLVCILTLCTVGSYAAWLAGNVVLGSFTLFLTFCIGIRFLVKPDTSKSKTASKGEKLDWKGVLISLFFGLTIGFGTGFVGTGGGMMMLVVFTAFLGMELKTAVGTSTFIITFTALIASVSHILIHPAIILEKWHMMLIAIVTATVFSLYSARFANRVNNKTVGLVTGGVLTVLGACMIILHYMEFIHSVPLLYETLLCFRLYLVYILPFAAILIVLHYVITIPKYIFRKLLHLAAFTSSVFVCLHAEHWLPASLTMVVFAVIVYPILALAEQWPGYGDLFVEKHPGEIKESLLLLFGSQALLIGLSWGLGGVLYPCICASFTWGFGDAAAGIIGRKYGKHIIQMKLTDGKKTREGFLANMAVSFVTALLTLWLFSLFSLPVIFLSALAIAPASAFTELISKGGMDTVTVPVVLTVLIMLIRIIV